MESKGHEEADLELPDNVCLPGMAWTLCGRAIRKLKFNNDYHREKFMAVLEAQKAYEAAVHELALAIGFHTQVELGEKIPK